MKYMKLIQNGQLCVPFVSLSVHFMMTMFVDWWNYITMCSRNARFGQQFTGQDSIGDRKGMLPLTVQEQESHPTGLGYSYLPLNCGCVVSCQKSI
jgi:hypothetical protein